MEWPRRRIEQVVEQVAQWLRARRDVDARPAALLRMALGLAMLNDLTDRLYDMNAFYTDGGFLPQSGFSLITVFALTNSPVGVGVLFASGIALSLALLLGYRARLVTIASCVFMISLQRRSALLQNGADDVLRLLLMWGMFIDWGAVWSLDVALGRRRAATMIPALPVRIAQLQIVCIYAIACGYKLSDDGPWLDGTAVLYALRAPGIARPPALWLMAHPDLCALLTSATLVIEGLFPILVLSPVASRFCRGIALVLGFGLHASIGCLMRVGAFSLIMPLTYTILLMPKWLTRVGLVVRANSDGNQPKHSRWRHGIHAFLIANFLLSFTTIAPNVLSGPIGIALDRYVRAVAFVQTWVMFHRPPVHTADWIALGLREDGTMVDVIPIVAPRLRDDIGWTHTRWSRVRGDLIAQRGTLKRFGGFLCRGYADLEPARPLVRIDVFFHSTAERGSGVAAGDSVDLPQTIYMLSQPCR